MYKLFIITVIILAISCSQESGDYTVFHYNQVNSVNSLDPAFARSQTNIWAVNHIYNTLVDLDDNLNVVPSLAKSWVVSKDGLKYKFNINVDILYHENPCFGKKGSRTLTAEDVVYSFNRIIDEKVNSPGSWIFKDRVDKTNPFSAENDSIFIINLKSPFRPFLSLLSMKYCSVVPREAITFYGQNFRQNPVGTGPLKFKRWVENTGLYLMPNLNYFEGTIEYDGVRSSYISDKKIAFLELLKGNLDFVSGLESSFIDELLDNQGNLLEKHKDDIQYYKSPYLNTEYIGINMMSKDPLLSDVNFRKALNYAIDKKEMLQLLRNNVGNPANSGIIPLGLPSFDENINKGYEYSPEKAKEFLEKSNFSDHPESELRIATNLDYLDIITYVARQWELIGINVSIDQMESSVLRSGMRSGDIDLFRASWIADYPDAENFLSLFYSKNGAPPNYTRFLNSSFDALYEKALTEVDDKIRINIYQKLNQIVIDECPVIFLFYDETALFYSKRIENPSINALNQLNVKQLKILN